jgi:hypothetical protein
MKRLSQLIISLCLFQFANAQCDHDPTIEGELILCPNSNATLSTQTYDAYQWYKREYGQPTSSPIPGDTLQTISVNNPDDVLYYFSVETTLNDCSELSPEVLVDGWVFLPVTVASTGDFTIGNNGESIVCIGDTMYFSLNLPYTKNITWFRNGNPISGETSTILTVTAPGQYTVTAAPDICPDYMQSLGLTLEVLFIECTTGINEELSYDKSTLIYPNPASDQITIESKGEAIINVTIYNSVGQIINKENVSGEIKALDVSALSKGIYILEIKKTTGKEMRRVLIN